MNESWNSDLPAIVYFGKSTDLQFEFCPLKSTVEVPFDELLDRCLSFTLKRYLLLL